jgi:deazaflavin-dependent oxidoreductase (nitroreductase family)
MNTKSLSSLRQFFHYLNRYFMVPTFRLGLGATVGNPFSGYIMVVNTTGRRSGKTRSTPVNYAILNGSVYCMSGWGGISDWYRNLLANPQVELILPSGSLTGTAETVSDPEERRTALRQVLRAAGFAGFLEGFNPITASDEEIEEKIGGLPLVRIRPTGLAAGPYDAGGWGWISVFALSAAFLALLWRKK